MQQVAASKLMTENGDSANGLEICSGNSESTDNYYSCSRYRKAEREIKHATQRCCSRSRGKNRSRFCGKALVLPGPLASSNVEVLQKIISQAVEAAGSIAWPVLPPNGYTCSSLWRVAAPGRSIFNLRRGPMGASRYGVNKAGATCCVQD
ncbi:hypothetical protein VTI28DRAFT_1627 [Corynascus sepedonium]